uniref:Carbohydrate sulfotransferase n=1 Tax=Grammatophora oceanica TaxID=210454 RepID=A0A7S1US72_9STRA|mmetsp:Transcript_20127/g.29880  ORF Transcript_20127/g.29880 Transcript_20127/m.29880 type:complete len:354 (+) Transcript_20127:127-1188(+)|eukprot:CAMPEP_0194045034 /NCGR_PEP_ID=MMETSP0009_2-20130614/16415_1 /TAXON_ID=210454 /ORGANISM="Grammatophora oceanica, Strain CCMP 410" /LENGTH=353 /DNA_ID=CAMNT_0038689755 /DNA_START=116 /DNA_END=1177 /DNA_ORIENTATION=+
MTDHFHYRSDENDDSGRRINTPAVAAGAFFVGTVFLLFLQQTFVGHPNNPTVPMTMHSSSSDVSEQPEWTLTDSSLSELEILEAKSGCEEELATLESADHSEMVKQKFGYKEELATFESFDAEMGTEVVNTAPYSMWFVNDSLLWCANAEVATSTIYVLLSELGLVAPGYRCNKKQAWRELQGGPKMRSKVQKAISFTLVRSPWERLRATYIGKILTNRIQLDGFDHVASFAEFVAYVGKNWNQNVHWQPFSTRCLTSPDENGHMFHYDHIIKLEDGDMLPKLHQIFTEAGISVPDELLVAKNQHTIHTGDTLIQFYRDAATPVMPMEDIIEAVGEIYRDDVESLGYSFPEYD